ncbi:hypothetical protein HHX47_DHR2000523 [Lentinula edodes]|nr:hypothetical protein HHX47_DHR2000523 [Lentinula edodes]
MTEHAANPLISPYGKSVLTAYHAACAVLDDTRIQYQKKPLLVCRVWQIWSFAFSAAVSSSPVVTTELLTSIVQVIVGTVATNPNCLDVKPHPLEQFESACEVFRGAAEVSSRAAQALLVLNALLQKAIEVQKNHHNHNPTEFHSEQPYSPPFADRHRNQHIPDASSSAPHAYLVSKPLLKSENDNLFPSNSDRRLSLPASSPLSHPPDLTNSWCHPSNSHVHQKGTTHNITHAPHENGAMIYDRWTSLMNFNVLDSRHIQSSPNETSQFPH